MTIDPAFAAIPSRLHLHILDICGVNRHNPYMKALEPQLHNRFAVVHSIQGHAALCSTLDPYKFINPGFAASVIRQLNENLAEGAVAVKIWQNIGMDLKNAKGQFVMPDYPAFEPIYRDIAAHDKTLIAHVAEPTSLWQPPNPASPDHSYYMTHPECYMYRYPYAMSKAILALRDHLLAENPPLRVVGAPLGRFTRRRYGSSDQHRDEGVPCGPGVSHTNATCHNS